jgi:ubiquitin-protein ligase
MANDGVIPLSSLERRIMNELYLLYKQFDNVSILRDENYDSVVNIRRGNDHYSMTLGAAYPFKPPKMMMVNERLVKNVCKFDGTIFSNYLLEYYGATCICCSSILFNHSLWTPGFKINNVIDEIDKIALVKKKILTRILCNGIRNKYGCLIEFAKFEDYLFHPLTVNY